MKRIDIINTNRLRLFRSRLKITDHNVPRDVWMAFRTDEDRQMVCATAIVSDPIKHLSFGRYVDWLEVTDEHRRQGVASEMLAALRKFYHPTNLELSAGSESGAAFLDSQEQPA